MKKLIAIISLLGVFTAFAEIPVKKIKYLRNHMNYCTQEQFEIVNEVLAEYNDVETAEIAKKIESIKVGSRSSYRLIPEIGLLTMYTWPVSATLAITPKPTSSLRGKNLQILSGQHLGDWGQFNHTCDRMWHHNIRDIFENILSGK